MTLTEGVKKVADHFGYEAQSNQLIEECAELIQAVSKYRRAKANGQYNAELASKEQIALENLVEEIADVELMLEQVKYLLNIPKEDIQAGKIFKVNRTLGKIKAGVY